MGSFSQQHYSPISTKDWTTDIQTTQVNCGRENKKVGSTAQHCPHSFPWYDNVWLVSIYTELQSDILQMAQHLLLVLLLPLLYSLGDSKHKMVAHRGQSMYSLSQCEPISLPPAPLQLCPVLEICLPPAPNRETVAAESHFSLGHKSTDPGHGGCIQVCLYLALSQRCLKYFFFHREVSQLSADSRCVNKTCVSFLTLL